MSEQRPCWFSGIRCDHGVGITMESGVGMAKLDREQLIDLVARIASAEGSEEQLDEWLTQLQDSVADPHISDHIFWDFSNPPLTPGQIVDKALAYRPIVLGGPEQPTIPTE